MLVFRGVYTSHGMIIQARPTSSTSQFDNVSHHSGLGGRGLGHAGPSGKTCGSNDGNFPMTGGGFHHGKLGSKLKYLSHVLHKTGRFTYIYH